jgi:ZIP family zinc transporter
LDEKAALNRQKNIPYKTAAASPFSAGVSYGYSQIGLDALHKNLFFQFLMAHLASLLSALLLSAAYVHAHGGIDDGDGDPNAPLPVTDSTRVIASGNVGLAFGFVLLAAFFSALGSALPLVDILLRRIPRFSHIQLSTSTAFLSSGLGFAAGVLVFLSLGDLYPEAVHAWGQSKVVDKQHAGMIVWALMTGTFLLLYVGKRVMAARGVSHHHLPPTVAKTSHDTDVEAARLSVTNVQGEHAHDTNTMNGTLPPNVNPEDAARLKRLGYQIAFALALHNFPEGLALFAATLSSTKIGAIYAIALILHKLPEGVIIVLPFLFSFQSKVLAFVVAAVMALIGQILGALLGYLLFVTYWNTAVTGTLFAVVSAVLAWTVLGGMLPMARMYDPDHKYVTISVAAGIAFFAFVNALFSYATL